jgi:hypothetical protein
MVLIIVTLVIVVVIVVVVDNMIIAVAAAELIFDLLAHMHLQHAIAGLVLRVSLHSQDIGNTQSIGRIEVALARHKKEHGLLGVSISSILPLP